MKKILLITCILTLTVLFGMQRRQIDKDVQVFKKWELTKDLNLTEKQAEVFFPRVNELENNLERIRKEENKLYREMNRMIDENAVQKKRMDEILDQISDLERQKIELIHDHMKNLDDVLTPEQMAKYGVFEQKFKRQMKKKLKNSRFK
ncbi:MAG: hypothetical protein GXO91_01820 [FCB group bacterium]|nr:hypothetical protein [FCB group bacterium]